MEDRLFFLGGYHLNEKYNMIYGVYSEDLHSYDGTYLNISVVDDVVWQLR